MMTSFLNKKWLYLLLIISSFFAISVLSNNVLAAPCSPFDSGPGGCVNKTVEPNGTDSAYIIWAFGNASALKATLTAINGVISESSFKTLLLSIALIGIFVATFLGIGGKKPEKIVVYILLVWFIGHISYDLKAKVTIHEMASLTGGTTESASAKVVAISDVPFVIAFPFSAVSDIGYWLTMKIESYYSPQYTGYDGLTMISGTGGTTSGARIGFGAIPKALNAIKDYSTSDAGLVATTNNYIKECIMPLLYDGGAGGVSSGLMKDIINKEGVFDILVTNANPRDAVFVEIRESHLATTTTTGVSFVNGRDVVDCKVAKQYISDVFSATATYTPSWWGGTETPVSQTVLVNEFDNKMRVSAQLGASVIAFLGGNGATNDITGYTTTSKESLLKNKVMMDVFAGVNDAYASQLGIDSATASYALEQAEASQKANWLSIGKLFQETAQWFFVVLQVFIIGLTPIIMVFVFIPGYGAKVATNYFQLLAWLSLWMPTLAIIDNIQTMYLMQSMASLQNNLSGDVFFSMGNMGTIYDSANTVAMVAGFVATFVPMITWGLVKGGSMAFTGVLSGIASTAAAQAAATSMSTDSISHGNRNLFNAQTENRSGFNQSANQVNIGSSIHSGDTLNPGMINNLKSGLGYMNPLTPGNAYTGAVVDGTTLSNLQRDNSSQVVSQASQQKIASIGNAYNQQKSEIDAVQTQLTDQFASQNAKTLTDAWNTGKDAGLQTALQTMYNDTKQAMISKGVDETTASALAFSATTAAMDKMDVNAKAGATAGFGGGKPGDGTEPYDARKNGNADLGKETAKYVGAAVGFRGAEVSVGVGASGNITDTSQLSTNGDNSVKTAKAVTENQAQAFGQLRQQSLALGALLSHMKGSSNGDTSTEGFTLQNGESAQSVLQNAQTRTAQFQEQAALLNSRIESTTQQTIVTSDLGSPNNIRTTSDGTGSVAGFMEGVKNEANQLPPTAGHGDLRAKGKERYDVDKAKHLNQHEAFEQKMQKAEEIAERKGKIAAINHSSGELNAKGAMIEGKAKALSKLEDAIAKNENLSDTAFNAIKGFFADQSLEQYRNDASGMLNEMKSQLKGDIKEYNGMAKGVQETINNNKGNEAQVVSKEAFDNLNKNYTNLSKIGQSVGEEVKGVNTNTQGQSLRSTKELNQATDADAQRAFRAQAPGAIYNTPEGHQMLQKMQQMEQQYGLPQGSLHKLAYTESSGDYTIGKHNSNPESSARGLFGITNDFQKDFGGGMTPDQLRNMSMKDAAMVDIETAAKGMSAAVSKLNKAGFEVNETNLAIMHKLGHGGGIALLAAEQRSPDAAFNTLPAQTQEDMNSLGMGGMTPRQAKAKVSSDLAQKSKLRTTDVQVAQAPARLIPGGGT